MNAQSNTASETGQPGDLGKTSISAKTQRELVEQVGAAKMKNDVQAVKAFAGFGDRARAVLLSLLSLSAVSLLDPAAAQNANPYDFKKEAFKPDGTPWTGPVHAGDIIKYVLSYKPGPTNSGPVTIDDTLSPNQTYLPPTKASDSGWTWGSSPYSNANHETYSHPGFGPGTGTVKVTVTGLPAPVAGTGDGTIPIPILSLNKVFGVFHHAGTAAVAQIDCWDLTTLAKCGVAQPNATSSFLHTPLTPQSVIRGTKFYFLGYRDGTGTVSIGCFDGLANAPCADTPLPPTVNDIGRIAGLVEDGAGRAFAAVDDKIFCRILPGTNCTGWPATGFVSVTGAINPVYSNVNVLYVSMEYGPSPTRLYVHHSNALVQCIDISQAAPAVCAGWVTTGTKVNVLNGGEMLSSFPQSGSSGDGGVCLWRVGVELGCLSSAGAPISVTPASILPARPISTFRLPPPNSGKIYFPRHYNLGGPLCVEYSGTTGTVPCSGYTPSMPPPIAGKTGTQYGFALDPRDPTKCMLSLGHDNMLWRFDYVTGKVGCGDTTTAITPKIEDIYCNGTPNPATFQWNSIHVLTAGAAGTLTITQGNNTPVPLTISTGTTNYAMPSGIGPGYGQLSFSFTPASGAPTTVDLEIGFTSDKNPQICYQARVKGCGDPVFNTAVFKGNFNNAPVNVSQKVDLGKAIGPDCPELTGCLKDIKAAVKCNPNGTYTVTLAGGFSGNDITLTSQTAGVTVTPPMQPDAPTTTWTVSGAAAGQIVTLTANATKVGGGKEDGTDLCCSGEIKIVMPECKKPPIDVAIGKENTPAGGQGNAFNIWVTNVGAPITFPAGAGGLTVTDAIPPGMNVTSVNAPNWTCKPVPLTGPGTMTCIYNLAGSLATGAQLPDAIVVNAVITNHEQPLKNCAQIAIGATVGLDTNPSNNQACVPVTGTGIGKLVVEKKVKNNTNASNAVIDAMVFPIGVTCGPPSNLNASFGLHNGGSHAENNIAVGSVCKVTEAISTLPPAPRRVCGDGSTAVWSPPVITPTSATIGSGTTVFTVVNELTCKRTGEVGSLVVTKKVIDHSPLPIPASQTYPVTVTCGGIVKNLTLVEGVSQTVSNIPLGTSCSVVEGPVAALPNVCPVRTTPTWSTVYVPPGPVLVNAATTAVTIVNTLTCSQLQGCLPPLIPGAIPGTCVCPRGEVLVGKECVKPPACVLPLVLVGVQCICPPGTVQQGKECVKQPICVLPLIPLGGQCVCPPGTVKQGKDCVRPIDCLPSQILVGGKCACPPGTVQQGQACVKLPACDVPGMIPGPGGRCVCPPGTVQAGKECVKQEACVLPMIPGAVAGQCVCPKGTVQQGRRCVPPIECRSPLIPNAAGTDCVCRPGLVQKGRTCVEPVVCNPPARLNREGACECPRDMVAKGNSCVERERPTPGATPREPPRGGGRDNEPPRGRDNEPPRGSQSPTDLPGRR
jgi:hypothetical protein